MISTGWIVFILVVNLCTLFVISWQLSNISANLGEVINILVENSSTEDDPDGGRRVEVPIVASQYAKSAGIKNKVIPFPRK